MNRLATAIWLLQGKARVSKIDSLVIDLLQEELDEQAQKVKSAKKPQNVSKERVSHA